MRFISIILLSCFFFISCDNYNANNVLTPEENTPARIAQGSLYGGGLEGIAKQNLVITTQSEWDNLKKSMNSVNSNATNNFSEKKKINFSKYQIIAVFDKVNSNGSWNIEITDITEYRDSIAVNVNIQQLKEALTLTMTQPYHIVKIPVSKKKIVFQQEENIDIDTSKINFGNIENLHAQPLPVIQKCVRGKWQLKGVYGEFSGWMPVPDNVFVEINGNRLNDREFQWKKHKIQHQGRTSFTYAIQYVEFDEPSLFFGKIKNDSLYVRYTSSVPTNSYDCFMGELWVRMK